MAFPLAFKKVHLLAAGAAVALGAAGFGVLELSSSNEFCYLCHFDERFQKPWRASAHFKKDVRCKDCHFGPGVMGLADAKWLGAKDAVFALATAEDFNNNEIYTRAAEEKCRKCHNAYGRVNVLAGKDLPQGLALKVDSLAFDHARHDETRQYCERCHSAGVYFFAVNYMTCESCHAGLVHKTDAKYDRPVPRADRCSRCHNGRVHVWGEKAGGLKDGGVFFYNDCPANTEPITDGVTPPASNCARCHPAVGAAAAAAEEARKLSFSTAAGGTDAAAPAKPH